MKCIVITVFVVFGVISALILYACIRAGAADERVAELMRLKAREEELRQNESNKEIASKDEKEEQNEH